MNELDTVLLGGTVLTQDPAMPRAAAVGVAGGRVAFVGGTEETLALAGPGTRRIDLGGRALLPGFNDAHAHLWKIGHLLTTMIDLRGVTSLGELGRRVRERARAMPAGGWVVGRGYNEAFLAERRQPTRHDLDAAAADRPVFLTRTCGHMAVANSLALSVAGVTAGTPEPPGGVIERNAGGEPTGLLKETAMGLVGEHVPEPRASEYESMLLAASRAMLTHGITTTSDAGVTPALIETYRDLDARGALPTRVNVMALRRPLGSTAVLPVPARLESERLRIDTVKLIADGGLSGATAALRVPYRHCCDDFGVLRLTRDELVELGDEPHRRGYRIAVHAIGDACIEHTLDAFTTLYGRCPGARHRLEHFGLADAAQMARAKELGLIAVPQTVFIHELGANFRRYLPDELLARCYAVGSMLRAGLDVALSSDAPVVADASPLTGIRAAVTRLDDTGAPIALDEKITVAQALWGYTMGGAVAAGDEKNRGSISRGKWADLVVLSRDPLTVEPGAVDEIEVDMTLVAGAIAYER